jgi:hypothetical protein
MSIALKTFAPHTAPHLIVPERLQASGVLTRTTTPEELRSLMKAEIEIIGPLVKSPGWRRTDPGLVDSGLGAILPR